MRKFIRYSVILVLFSVFVVDCGNGIDPGGVSQSVSVAPSASPKASSSPNPSPSPSASASASPSPTPTSQICVLDASGQISTFDALGSGNLSPISTFGNLTGINNIRGIAYDAVHSENYVLSVPAYGGYSSIIVFSRSSNGNVAYSRRVVPTVNAMDDHVAGLAVDSVNNEVAFIDITANTVSFYSNQTTGVSAPVRTMTCASSCISSNSSGLIIDTTNNEVLVANGTEVDIFSRSFSCGSPPCSLTPLRTISGFTQINSIALDLVHNEVFISDNDTSVGSYDRTSGALKRTLTNGGSSPALQAPAGLTYAAASDELIISDQNANTSSKVKSFPRTASGNANPSRSLTLNGTEFVDYALAYDSVNDEVYSAVSDPSGANNNYYSVFSRTGTGAIAASRQVGSVGFGVGLSTYAMAVDLSMKLLFVDYSAGNSIGIVSIGGTSPTSIIAGSNTTLSTPTDVVVDTINQELIVTSATSILVFPESGSGNLTPTRQITGASTQLGNAFSSAVNTLTNEIMTADDGTEQLNTYNRTANGNVAPTRVISGASTSFVKPLKLLIDQGQGKAFTFDAGVGALDIFSTTASGNIAPVQVTGGNTGFVAGILEGIGLNPNSSEIYVTNTGNSTIQVFPETASGNVKATRTISGSNTQLAYPVTAIVCK